MNYGESLAYWYFRLNGFLPLQNFVLHEPNEETGQDADIDLLAVRFPHVFENIGGHPNDWDNERFVDWQLDHTRNVVCVIVEVKTGWYKKGAVNRHFDRRRLEYAILRFGIFEKAAVPAIARTLEAGPVVKEPGFTVAKILIDVASKRPGPGAEDGLRLSPCLRITIDDVSAFIRRRMRVYKEHKGAARMFFPGDFIQYMAWQAGVPLAIDDDDAANE
ncbi:MAG: hypothetical protein ABSF26_02915 [Thermoguttaceae bacterium]|jgi:hypothetical protein